MAHVPASQADFYWNGTALEGITSIEPEYSKEAWTGGTGIKDTANKTLYTIQNPRISVTFALQDDATVQAAVLADFLAGTVRAIKHYLTTAHYMGWNGTIATYKPSGIDAKGYQLVTITIDGTSDGVAAAYT